MPTMPYLTGSGTSAPHMQPGYAGRRIKQERMERQAEQQAGQMQNLLTQAGPQFEDLIQTMTGAYGARGSRGARAAQEAALMSGFSPLEASAAAEDQLNRAMQAYYQMIPQMRFEYLNTMAPLWGQLAQLYSGLGQQELQSQALMQEMAQGQQMVQQPSPMEQALAMVRQATLQRMFGGGEGQAQRGRAATMDYRPLGRVSGAGGGGGGLLGSPTYPAAAGGFLAPMPQQAPPQQPQQVQPQPQPQQPPQPQPARPQEYTLEDLLAYLGPAPAGGL